MNKTDALIETVKRFTNLIDGNVVPRAGVITIISYYESLLQDEKPVVTMSPSGIESNFIEEDILNKADYWDGDETDKISY
jgi:hypothetical protein